MGKMDGLVAIVTGASRGLGRAIARAYAREGARVVICARPQSPSGLSGTTEETAASIRSDGGEVLSIACDVADQGQVEHLVQQVMARYGQIDVLFNNAGLMVLGQTLGQIDPEQWDQVMAVNLRGPLLDVPLCRAGHDGAGTREYHQHWVPHGRRPVSRRRGTLQLEQGGRAHVQLLFGR